jgi:hypothetical protein
MDAERPSTHLWLQSDTIHPKDTPLLLAASNFFSTHEIFHPLVTPLAAWRVTLKTKKTSRPHRDERHSFRGTTLITRQKTPCHLRRAITDTNRQSFNCALGVASEALHRKTLSANGVLSLTVDCFVLRSRIAFAL